MLEFSQELSHHPGQPVQLWMDKAQRYILNTLGTCQKLPCKDAATFLWLLPAVGQRVEWHVQEAFGRNERQNQGLKQLASLYLQTKPIPPGVPQGHGSFYPLAAPYGSPFMQSPFLTAFPGWGMHPPVHKGKCSSERVKRFMLINPDCLFP